MADDDVRLEVEAVQAVYGDDSHLISDFPPHLILHIKPRTADDSSQQFVEATFGIKASAKYPEEPPHIYIIDVKGLDDGLEAHLITSIRKRAKELSSCFMLVALCEEAVDLLTNMNHPVGDCPLCLYPLVPDNTFVGTYLPFMKLMSCYHCFHSDCMIGLWRWTQEKNDINEANRSSENVQSSGQVQKDYTSSPALASSSGNQLKGSCPVCRKQFDVKDIEHVLEFIADNSSAANPVHAVGAGNNEEDTKAVLLSEAENNRRQKFDSIFKVQQAKKGLIEPRKALVIMPGMFLPETVDPPTTSADEKNEECKDGALIHGLVMNGGPSMKATTSRIKNINRRRKGSLQGFTGYSNSESSNKQWAVKPMDTSKQ